MLYRKTLARKRLRGGGKRRGKQREGRRKGKVGHISPSSRTEGSSSLAQSSYARASGDLMTGLTPSAALTPHRALPRWVCRSLTPICHSFNSGEIFSISQQFPTCYRWGFSSLKVPRPFVGACVYLRAACFTRSYNRKRVATSTN